MSSNSFYIFLILHHELVYLLFKTKNAYRAAQLPNYIDEWTYQLTYNAKVYQFGVYRLVLLSGPFASYTRKVYQFGVYRLVLFFSHLFTYLGPLYQLKGVSATAEKRVLDSEYFLRIEK